MRKRTARTLRRIANHLDPAPPRWYQVNTSTGTSSASSYRTSAIQQSGLIYDMTIGPPRPKRRRRVLADYLTPMDLKKLRP